MSVVLVVMLAVFAAMLVALVVTLVLVVLSCEPFTASVEVALTAPSATLVRFCATPGAAPVPPDATSASLLLVPVCCTGPTVPLLMLVIEVLSVPSALSTVLKAEVTLVAGPVVPAIELAFVSAKLVPVRPVAAL